MLGTARHSSLRNHCLSLEHILRVDKHIIAWTEQSIRSLLNHMSESEHTPAQIQKAWKTLKWLSKTLGLMDPESIEELGQKKEYIRQELTKQLLPTSRRAIVPTLNMIRALEEASHSAATGADRYAASLFRFMAGSSARFNDVMHTQLQSLQSDATTVELTAWQTKVTGVLTTQRPMPLIAPKHTFTAATGADTWWDTLERHIKAFNQHPAYKDLDYLLPTPTRDRTGFIPRPCSNAQGLRWLRTILTNSNLPFKDREFINKITLPSLRVWMADLAYQSGVDRDKRRYIGRWASESTADTYTREHRKVICEIWKIVTADIGGHKTLHSTPEDLTDSHYRLDRLPLAPQQPIPGQEANTWEADWTVIDQEPPAQDDINPKPRAKRIKTKAITIHCTPADQVHEDHGGPLTPASNIKRNTSGTRKIHLLTTEGKGIGCGWRPRTGQTLLLSEHDITDDTLSECDCCFRHFTYPLGWTTTGGSPATSDSDISSDNSNLSPDTDSEAEAFRMPV